MKKITDRQQEVLSFIAYYIEENSFPPTIREIGEHFKIGPKAVQGHIMALQKKGFLQQNQNRSRAFKIVSGGRKTLPRAVEVPILGSVAAGLPLLCEENIDGHLVLAEPFVRQGKNYFALRVRGESMVGAGILDGDFAIVEQASTAENGQIVVAVIDEAITLKRFFREASRIKLKAENPAFKPIYCREVRVVGILASIVRSY